MSPTTPPAAGLRVVIRNLSQARAGDIPYSDREYDRGSRSESFVVALGNRHHSKFLSLDVGDNELGYEIKRDDRVVESGKFTVRIGESTSSATRTKTIARPKQDLACEHKK